MPASKCVPELVKVGWDGDARFSCTVFDKLAFHLCGFMRAGHAWKLQVNNAWLAVFHSSTCASNLKVCHSRFKRAKCPQVVSITSYDFPRWRSTWWIRGRGSVSGALCFPEDRAQHAEQSGHGLSRPRAFGRLPCRRFLGIFVAWPQLAGCCVYDVGPLRLVPRR